MKRLPLSTTLLIIFLTIEMTWYSLLTISYVQAGQIEGADFRWFYAVGTVWRNFGPQNSYDLDLASTAQAEAAGIPAGQERLLLPNHPPFVFPIMALLAGLPYREAYFVYLACIVIITSATLVVLNSRLGSNRWHRRETILLSIGILLFEPFFISILRGQDTYILLIGGMFLLAGVVGEKDWLAGVGLGLILIRPQIALALALPFLFRQRRIWWWFLGTGIILGLYSLLQVGFHGALAYAQVLLLSTGVQGYGWDEKEMFNLVGALIRCLPGTDVRIIHAIGWCVYGMTLAGLPILWSRSRSMHKWQLSLAVVLSLLVAPHLHYHDLALLAIPLILLIITVIESGKLQTQYAVLIPFGLSVILIISEHFIPAHTLISYLLMMGLPFFTWKLERIPFSG
jgi:hypothetical protein